MNAIFMLLPYLFLLATLVVLTVGIIRGVKRGFGKSLTKTITTVCAIIISIVVLIILKAALGGLVSSAVDNLIENITNNGGDGSTDKIINAILKNETVKEIIKTFPFAMMAPFVFVTLFAIFKPISALFNKLLDKRLDGKIKMSEKASKISGGAISGFTALVTFLIFLMPTIGIINFVGLTYKGIPKETTEKVEAMSYLEGVAKTSENPAFKSVSLLGANFTFNQLSAVKVDGERVYPYKEFGYVANAAISVLPLVEDDMDNYSELHVKGIDRFSQSVVKSKVFIKIFPDLLKEIGDEIIKVDGDDTDPKAVFLNSVKTFLTSNDESTIKDDLVSVADIFEVLINHNFFKAYKKASDGGDNDAFLEVIAYEKKDNDNEVSMLGELLYVLSQNSRTVLIIPDAANLGLWYFCDIMEIPEDYEKSRTELLESLTEIISTNNEDTDKFAKKLKAEFGKHGLTIDISTATALAKAIESTANVYNVNDLTAFLKEATQTKYGGTVNGNLNRFEFARSFNNDLFTVISDLEAGREVSISDFIKDDEVTAVKLKKSFDAIEALAYDKGFAEASRTYTYHELKVESSSLDNVTEEEMIKEGNLIAGVVFNALTFKNSLPEQSDAVSVAEKSDFGSLGRLFDELEKSILFGNSSRKLLVASLRSRLMQGLDILTDSMVDQIEEKENLSAVKLFGSVKETILLVNKLGKEDAKDEEIKDSMKNLIETLDTTTAGVINEMITKDTVKTYGVSDESAGPVSKLFKNIMTDFGNAEGLSDDQYQKEVKAIQYLYKAAETKPEQQGKPMFGENGRYSSADDFVETMMASNVMLNSANKTSYDKDGNPEEDPLNVKNRMSENDKQALTQSVEKYYNEHKTNDSGHNEQLKKDLIAIGILMNVDVSGNLN